MIVRSTQFDGHRRDLERRRTRFAPRMDALLVKLSCLSPARDVDFASEYTPCCKGVLLEFFRRPDEVAIVGKAHDVSNRLVPQMREQVIVVAFPVHYMDRVARPAQVGFGGEHAAGPTKRPRFGSLRSCRLFRPRGGFLRTQVSAASHPRAVSPWSPPSQRGERSRCGRSSPNGAVLGALRRTQGRSCRVERGRRGGPRTARTSSPRVAPRSAQNLRRRC